MSLDYFKKFATNNNENKINTDVWSYTRVSSKEQFENNNSVENQTKSARNFAMSKGLQISKTFGGTYESASGDFSRKEFLRLYNEVKKSKNRPYAILIFKMSRFSRTGASAIGLVYELIHSLGVHLIETSTGKDTSTVRGEHEIMESLLYARKENIERAEITIPGMKSFLEKGNWLGVVPKGYDHYGPRVSNPKFVAHSQRIEINEEGKLLKKAWNWKLNGELDFQIVEKLQKQGLNVDKKFVSAMWRKPFYCGIIVHKFLDGNFVKGNWKGLVSIDGFKKINQILDNNHSGYKQSKIDENRPLQAFVSCGVCGTKVTGYVKKEKYHYYKCNNSKCSTKDMNALTSSKSKNIGLNNTFQYFLSKFELKDELTEAFREQIKLTIQSIENENTISSPKLLARQNKLLVEQKKLKRNLAFSVIDKSTFDEFNTEIQIELNMIHEELQNVNSSVSNFEDNIQQCIDITKNISKIWESSDVNSKIKLQKLVFPEGVVVDPKKRTYRTPKINTIFKETLRISSETEGQKKDSSVNLTDESLLVAGARLELTTFGL